MGYCGLCIWAAARYASQSKHRLAPITSLPPVSLLKPLKGTDPEMYESFRSHCLQNYPEYEMIFGVSDSNDPAIVEVERLKREFPGRNIRLVHCEKVLGANIKISNLVQMLPTARHDY